jgi:hypothetical protein
MSKIRAIARAVAKPGQQAKVRHLVCGMLSRFARLLQRLGYLSPHRLSVCCSPGSHGLWQFLTLNGTQRDHQPKQGYSARTLVEVREHI